MKMTIPGLTLAIFAAALQSCGGGVVKEDPSELPESASPLYISEYMCAERWVEIYNPTDSIIDLHGYSLIAGARKRKADIHEIGPKGYVLFKDLHDMEEGLPIYLKDNEGALVDIVDNPKHKKNKSTTRLLLGDGSFMEDNTERWTPGFPNDLKGYRAYRASRHKENTSGIFLSEICADNESAYTDPDGNFVDFIEIFNGSDKAVDISGWGLSDKENFPLLFRFPERTKIQPGEYIVVNCSKDYQNVSKPHSYCAPFSISNGEEGVFLSDRDGYILQEVFPVSMLEDQSMISLNGKAYIGTYCISPGYPNTTEGAMQYAKDATPDVLPQLFIAEANPGDESSAGWIELQNHGADAVQLKGLSLTDENPDRSSFTFPEKSIPAGGRLLVYSGTGTAKGIASGFEYRKSAAMFLRGKDGEILDYVTLSDIPLGMSKGREGQSAAWMFYRTPTPGAANKGGVAALNIAPIASIPSGQYDDIESLKVEFFADGDIYYTTDGSAPTTQSRKYKEPFILTQTGVIRTMAVKNGTISSPVSSWTYLVNEGHTLDVVSMVSAPAGLFSESTGIYSNGGHILRPNGQEEGPGIPYPYVQANFWRKWVRQCNLSLLPKDGQGFSVDCGTSIFGGYSRINAKKSFKFKFKRKYGAGKLHYKLFDNRDFSDFDCIVMRTGGQDAYYTLIKDDLASYLMDDLLDVMATRPTVFYINGEYYGIYWLREKVNKHFIASHYNVPTDGIDIIQGNCHLEHGSIKEWNAFFNFATTHDLTNKENYQYMKDHMDLQSYADWVIAEAYIGNKDAGNVRVFKSKHMDNKWHWLLYDVDLGLISPRNDGCFLYLKPQSQKICSTDIIRALLKNKEFRALFLDRLEYQMHNVWNKEHMNEAIDMFVEMIDSEVERNNNRWQNTYKGWQGRIEGLRKFANERQAYLKEVFNSDATLRGILHMSKEELDRCFE